MRYRKDEPIGMMRQVGDGVVVTGGEYPMKESIKMINELGGIPDGAVC